MHALEMEEDCLMEQDPQALHAAVDNVVAGRAGAAFSGAAAAVLVGSWRQFTITATRMIQRVENSVAGRGGAVIVPQQLRGRISFREL